MMNKQTPNNTSKETTASANTVHTTRLATINRAARFWAVFFGFTLLILLFQASLINSIISRNQRIIITDASHDCHITAVKNFEESHDLIAYIARIAAYARLERNQSGLTNQVLFEQLYLPSAIEKAKKEVDADKTLFAERLINQECIIEKAPEIRRIDKNSVFICVYGRLLRTGQFKKREFVQYLDFKLDLHILRNPYLKRKGRLPLAVLNYHFKTRLSKETS